MREEDKKERLERQYLLRHAASCVLLHLDLVSSNLMFFLSLI
jgi:hypothetical protein